MRVYVRDFQLWSKSIGSPLLLGYLDTCSGGVDDGMDLLASHHSRRCLLSRILLTFPSKSSAHWFSAQHATVTCLAIIDLKLLWL